MQLIIPFSTDGQSELAQVGGILQHGAVVAREYGKPCVAAIEKATTIFQDGQWVELDGTHGTVTLLSKNGNHIEGET